MSVRKKFTAVSVLLGLTLTLTACDPPMPEDLKIALAEKNVLCESGNVELQLPESNADLGFGWADAAAMACPEMQITVTEKLTENSGLLISASGLSDGQTSFLNIPFAIDAAVLVVNITDAFEIYLSAETIVEIFSGEIKTWNDPKILADNSGIDLPNLKIILPTQATASAKATLAAWIKSLTGKDLNLSKVADATASQVELASPIENGSIGIASYSAATFTGATIAAILTEPGNIDTAVLPATETLYSASTQLAVKTTDDFIALSVDPKIKPSAPEGSKEAAMPYQAIYPVYLNFVGEESVLVRTAGRYLLRQESQGVITSGTMLPIPESVRILAVKIVEKGLPKASLPKSE